MSTINWDILHKHYESQEWIYRPSIFAQTAIKYFPTTGSLLELGAGLGQDSRYFAEGFQVTSTDISAKALHESEKLAAGHLKEKINYQVLDLQQDFPFADNSFDIVYAHLSLHYFDKTRTAEIFKEIIRVLKPQGLLACLLNSQTDPEYSQGEKIEEDYFLINGVAKRYFSTTTLKQFTAGFNTVLLDSNGSSVKDLAKNVGNLIRFIGHKK